MSSPSKRAEIQVSTGAFGKVTKSASTTRAKVGETLPPATLPATSGRQVDLAAEAESHHVVLFFYPGDLEGLRYPEMSGCTPEACMFRDNLGLLRDLGAVVFGINLHLTGRQRSFVEREHLNFELLSDSESALTNALGVPVWRTEHGEIFVARTTLIIERGGVITKIFDDVQPSGHLDQVIASIQMLQR